MRRGLPSGVIADKFSGKGSSTQSSGWRRKTPREPKIGSSGVVDIAQLLTFSVKQGASDLHLSAGVEPMIRVDGDLKRITLPPLEHKQVHDMIYDIMNDRQRKAYDEFFETDFSFEIPGLAR